MNEECNNKTVELAVNISLGKCMKNKADDIRKDAILWFNDLLYYYKLIKSYNDITKCSNVKIYFNVNARNYLYVKYTFYHPDDLDKIKQYKHSLVRLLSAIVAHKKLDYKQELERIESNTKLNYCFKSLRKLDR